MQRQRITGGSGHILEPLEPRQHFAAGTGLAGTYYNNTNFTGKSVTRFDARIYYDFTKSPPPAGVTPSTYSVRWNASIRPAFSETYTFYTKSDEGIRVWVNHKLLIDNWKPHALTENSGSIALSAGQKYDLQVEYFNNTGPAAAQLWWSSPSVAKSVVPTSRLFPRKSNVKDQIDHAFTFAEAQVTKAFAQVGKTSVDPYDNATTPTAWTTTGPDAWTSGFFPGAMWQIYSHNTKKSWRLNATAWTRPIGPFAKNGDDIGFRIWSSFFPTASSTRRSSDKQVLIAAANAKLANWNPQLGMFETAPGSSTTSSTVQVVIDQAMDMELLWWTSKETGNNDYRDKAEAHLLKLARNQIRSDGSVMQLGLYFRSTGLFSGPGNKQGAAATSTWSRGQAWAIHAYTTAYQQTSNPAFLNLARKVANYWVSNVPADGVPYWDFNAPGIPNTYRDTSAAAVAASGLTLLSQIAPNSSDKDVFKTTAAVTLSSLLSRTYFAEDAASPGLLLHGAHWVAKKQVDRTLIYGDYYLLQAMNRYLATV